MGRRFALDPGTGLALLTGMSIAACLPTMRRMRSALLVALVSLSFACDGRGYVDTTAINPSIVHGGDGYGVVWTDMKPDGQWGRWVVKFSALTAEGQSVGDEVVLLEHDGFQKEATLLWSGSEYAVVWYQHKGADGRPTDGIYFARLNAAGAVLGEPVQLTRAIAPASLVWTGSEYAIAWAGDLNGRAASTTVKIARLSASGELIEPPNDVAPVDASQALVDLAWTGTGYGLVWAAEGQVYFRSLSTTADVEADVRPLSPGDSPRIVWTGDVLGVSWAQEVDFVPEIFFARLSADGEMLGAAAQLSGRARAAAAAAKADQLAPHGADPQLCWSGSDFVVSWIESGADILYSRLSASGTLTDDGVAVTAGGGIIAPFGVSARGDSLAFAWQGAGFVELALEVP